MAMNSEAIELYVLSYLIGFIFFVWLFAMLHKFVQSHWRIANALEKIANKND